MRLALLLLVALAALWPAARGHAHALEPGYLEIEPAPDDAWRLTWRKPQVGGRPMAIDPLLPEGCTPRRAPEPRFDGRAYVAGWVARCERPIWEGEVRIEGLERTATDVLLRYRPAPDAGAQTLRLTPDAPGVVLPEVPTRWSVFRSYATLGVDHILSGLDHLLFIFALLLIVRGVRRLVLAITAFTVAHSITLVAAALGALDVPPQPVEAVIALSIAFLAAEILQRPGAPPTLLQRSPWSVAFAFGLLHGLGFAGALREIGLPEGEIPMALLAFNAGVEAGQLLFVAVVLGAGFALRLLAPANLGRLAAPGGRGLAVAAYAIGGIAAYWTIARVAAFAI